MQQQDTSQYQQLLDLLTRLASEPDTGKLLNEILTAAQAFTHADGGTLYLLKEVGGQRCLEFTLMHNHSLGISQGRRGEKIDIPPIPLYLVDGRENHHHVAAYVALSRQAINIADVYQSRAFDFSGARQFDAHNNYRSTSFLAVPLLNHDGDVIGVLQLINATSPNSGQTIAFSQPQEQLIAGLAKYAAVALDNVLLVDELKGLLDAFIRVIATAIDAKSSHTSKHCQQVPVLTEMLAQAACQDTGKFADFEFTPDQWYELHVAAWLHDCGKLATPDSVLDKSTKLETVHDRVAEIAARFAALRQQKQLAAWQQIQAEPDNKTAIEQQLAKDLATLADDLAFIQAANKGGEFMSAAHQDRIKHIAQIQWEDAYGQPQALLTADEVYNLCIERGTLTAEERQIIQDHIVVTIDMLNSLPFPAKLQRVPEYAGCHHEKVNGTGYPNGLTGEQMSIPARMMAIADIFEALTSKDRPYKDPMPLSQALRILQNMRKEGHIDGDLYRLFLEHRVWEKYAQQYLLPEQLDVTAIEPYL